MDYLLKASLVLLIFYTFYKLFLQQETFFQHNRWYFILGIILSVIFPSIVIPKYIAIDAPLITEMNSFTADNTQSLGAQSVFDWLDIAYYIYFIGLTVFVIQFIFQFGSLTLLLLKNPKHKNDIFTYVIVKSKISPFSFFKWIVYNPKSFDNQELNIMLTHERVHAKELHSIDILLVQLACIVFWFNPLVWLYKKELKQNLEYIADDKTQNNISDTKAYQHLLLKTSVTNYNISISNNLYNSLIKERIIMLKKSKSTKTKQLKYLLLLPALAVVLMSMNTKDIYVTEVTVKSENVNKKTLEFIVTKNTTDRELETMSSSVKENGGTLIFRDVKRNDANELVNIFVKLYNHSYGSGNSKSPIKPFVIYKELYGNGGGYVGGLENGTLHFDTPELNNIKNKQIKKLKKRAQKAFENKIIYSKQEIKEAKFEPKNSNLKVKTLTNTVTKVVSVITKNTTNTELKTLKNQLEKEGVTFKYKGVKRNANNEITAIKLEAKTEDSNVNYSISDADGIAPIKIIFNEEENSISIGNANTKKHNIFYEVDSDSIKLKHNNVFVYSNTNDGENENRIIIKNKGKRGKVKTIKSNKKVHVLSGEDDEIIEINVDSDTKNGTKKVIVNGKAIELIEVEEGDENIIINGDSVIEKKIIIKNHGDNIWINDSDEIIHLDDNISTESKVFIHTDDNKSPYIVIDGKVSTKEEMSKLKPDNIESINVIKGDKAIEKYGDNGKNGVIEIATKR